MGDGGDGVGLKSNLCVCLLFSQGGERERERRDIVTILFEMIFVLLSLFLNFCDLFFFLWRSFAVLLALLCFFSFG